jgi:hypothetical protein
MSGSDAKRAHPLTVIHVVAMFGILMWWSVYFWRHAPAREMLQARAELGAVSHSPPGGRGGRQLGTPGRWRGPARRRGDFPGIGLAATQSLGDTTRRAIAVVQTSMPDVAGGFVVLLIFALGTGIYVRRLEIWLQARGSGDAMDLAGAGLGDRALAANAGRRGGGLGENAR